MADTAQLAALQEGVDAFRRYMTEHYRDRIDLSGADLRGLDLSGINLGNGNFDDTNFEGCVLRGTRFNSASARRASFVNCDLTDTSFHRVDLTGANFHGATGYHFGVGESRLCVGAQSYDGVHWDREAIEYVLKTLNLNPDWEVRYELVKKPKV